MILCLDSEYGTTILVFIEATKVTSTRSSIKLATGSWTWWRLHTNALPMVGL